MGFFFRKSIRLGGGLRLNLSKSGIGLSAGVKGFRVGTGPRGAYVAGGKGPFYFRQNLGARRASSPAIQTISMASPSKGEGADGSGTVIGWVFFAFVALAVVAFLPRDVQLIAALAAGVTAVGVIAYYIHRYLYKKRLKDYSDLLQSRLTNESFSEADAQEVRDMKQTLKIKAADAFTCHLKLFETCLDKANEDGIITEAEKRFLDGLESVLAIPADKTKALLMNVYQQLYKEVAQDRQVTEEEMNEIKNLQTVLGIQDQEIAGETAELLRLRLIKKIKDGFLPEVQASIPLKDAEKCHFEGEAVLLKKKILGSYTRDGVKYKQEGFVPEKEGSIVLTSKRLIMLGDGSMNIALEKIFNVTVFEDSKRMEIIKDGRTAPYTFEVSDPLMTATILETSANQDRKTNA